MKHTLSEINIYPVKSLAGISLNEAEVTDRGLEYDRRWMLVDENNSYITQRTVPGMALIKVAFNSHNLEFVHKKNGERFSINVNDEPYEKSEIIVWSDTVDADFVSPRADEWFGEMLKIKCRLVHMPDSARRLVDKKYASKNEIVSFADGYPFLVIGQASLDDLNNRLSEKLPMNRFRPNFVFSGGEPFDEDRMKSFKLCGITFYPVKPCSRCIVTTTNQDTAERGKEPLHTLSAYRKIEHKIMFGQNLLHEGKGIVKAGEELKDVEWK
ncbi:MAG: MOSC domain-containing protein [Ignavibacteriales bacterium]|nr:MOSC domain-containing protein [Ignavibacteriales bacterium]